MRFIACLLGFGLVACGQRPDIDPAPYHDECPRDGGASCPAPYQCLSGGCELSDCSDGGPTYCYVTCSHDDDCPSDFFCNCVTQESIGMLCHVCVL
jgi:hypothetical protein